MTKDEIINRIAEINRDLTEIKKYEELCKERNKKYDHMAVEISFFTLDRFARARVSLPILITTLLVEKECLEEELKEIISNG